VDYVSCWADGVHFSIRLGEQSRLCCLVIVGVRADGRKEALPLLPWVMRAVSVVAGTGRRR